MQNVRGILTNYCEISRLTKTQHLIYSVFGKSLCTSKRCRKFGSDVHEDLYRAEPI